MNEPVGEAFIPSKPAEDANDFVRQVLKLRSATMEGPVTFAAHLANLCKKRDAIIAARATRATSAFIPKKDGPSVQMAIETLMVKVVEQVNRRRELAEADSSYGPGAAGLERTASALLALSKCYEW